MTRSRYRCIRANKPFPMRRDKSLATIEANRVDDPEDGRPGYNPRV